MVILIMTQPPAAIFGFEHDAIDELPFVQGSEATRGMGSHFFTSNLGTFEPRSI